MDSFKAVEQTIQAELRDLSRTNVYHLKAGLRILMTTNLETFEKVCSHKVQRDLEEFKNYLVYPESLVPNLSEADKPALLDHIRRTVLENLTILDQRTTILPNTQMVQDAIMEDSHLHRVIHPSTLQNLVKHTQHFAHFESELKLKQLSPAEIEGKVKKAIQSTQELHRAVLEGNITLALQCLAVPGVDINYPNQQGLTPLHLAVQAGFGETVKLLLTLPHIQIEPINHHGWTPLHLAARLGTTDIVDSLLAAGADPNILNSDGWTALHWAAWHGFTDIVGLLIHHPKIQINASDKNHTTPLHLAARNGHADIIHIMLVNPSIEVNKADNELKTPLILAATYGHDLALNTLLSSPNIDVNLQDVDGFTALHWAARIGDLTLFNILVQDPRTQTQIQDNNGMQAIEWAMKNQHEDLVLAHPTLLPKQKRSFWHSLKHWNNAAEG